MSVAVSPPPKKKIIIVFSNFIMNTSILPLLKKIIQLCFCFSLGPLVNKVKEFQVETIVDTLCSNMISDKEQLRDISSIGKDVDIC